MRAALLALALIACARAEDQVIVSGPIEYVRAAHAAALRCGAKTLRIEPGNLISRLVVGSDIGQPGAECIVTWVRSHEVNGSSVELKGGGPL